MITVSVVNKSNFGVSAKAIKDCVKKTFEENGISSDAEASVAIVSAVKMKEMAMKYMEETEEEAEGHPVLSFPSDEVEKPFVFPPDKTLHLGEIVVSYHHALEDSKSKNILVDEAVCELSVHGALHLIGIHHD